ncbi:unnamed protein product [Amoebophrya sp. A25]|nr:unnamed protein product [Amoebophrya sp. A25]|eukprot:GSA25T00010977001.1
MMKRVALRLCIGLGLLASPCSAAATVFRAYYRHSGELVGDYHMPSTVPVGSGKGGKQNGFTDIDVETLTGETHHQDQDKTTSKAHGGATDRLFVDTDLGVAQQGEQRLKTVKDLIGYLLPTYKGFESGVKLVLVWSMSRGVAHRRTDVKSVHQDNAEKDTREESASPSRPRSPLLPCADESDRDTQQLLSTIGSGEGEQLPKTRTLTTSSSTASVSSSGLLRQPSETSDNSFPSLTFPHLHRIASFGASTICSGSPRNAGSRKESGGTDEAMDEGMEQEQEEDGQREALGTASPHDEATSVPARGFLHLPLPVRQHQDNQTPLPASSTEQPVAALASKVASLRLEENDGVDKSTRTGVRALKVDDCGQNQEGMEAALPPTVANLRIGEPLLLHTLLSDIQAAVHHMHEKDRDGGNPQPIPNPNTGRASRVSSCSVSSTVCGTTTGTRGLSPASNAAAGPGNHYSFFDSKPRNAQAHHDEKDVISFHLTICETPEAMRDARQRAFQVLENTAPFLPPAHRFQGMFLFGPDGRRTFDGPPFSRVRYEQVATLLAQNRARSVLLGVQIHAMAERSGLPIGQWPLLLRDIFFDGGDADRNEDMKLVEQEEQTAVAGNQGDGGNRGTPSPPSALPPALRDRQLVYDLVSEISGWTLLHAKFKMNPRGQKIRNSREAAALHPEQADDHEPMPYADDYEIIKAAARSSPFVLQYASPRLRQDKSLALQVIEGARDGDVIERISPDLLADPDVVMQAITKRPLPYTTPGLREWKSSTAANYDFDVITPPPSATASTLSSEQPVVARVARTSRASTSTETSTSMSNTASSYRSRLSIPKLRLDDLPRWVCSDGEVQKYALKTGIGRSPNSNIEEEEENDPDYCSSTSGGSTGSLSPCRRTTTSRTSASPAHDSSSCAQDGFNVLTRCDQVTADGEGPLQQRNPMRTTVLSYPASLQGDQVPVVRVNKSTNISSKTLQLAQHAQCSNERHQQDKIVTSRTPTESRVRYRLLPREDPQTSHAFSEEEGARGRTTWEKYHYRMADTDVHIARIEERTRLRERPCKSTLKEDRRRLEVKSESDSSDSVLSHEQKACEDMEVLDQQITTASVPRQSCGNAYKRLREFAGLSLRQDRDMILIAAQLDETLPTLRHATEVVEYLALPEPLTHDAELILQLIRLVNPAIFHTASNQLQQNEDFALKAVQANSHVVHWLPITLRLSSTFKKRALSLDASLIHALK